MGTRIRVLVADDHIVVLEGLRAMLGTDPEVEVVGQASGGTEAIQKATDLRPGVILMDIRMADMDGIETARRIKESHPAIAVVMLTMYADDIHIIEALRAGASGYLLKDASRELLLHTVKAAAGGGTLVKSSLLQAAFQGRWPVSMSQTPAPRKGADELTRREFSVLELLARGYTNKEIAAALFISQLTVKKHVASVIWKLGAVNRSDAAVRAVRAGLVDVSLPETGS